MRGYQAVIIAAALVGVVVISAAVAWRRPFGDASQKSGAASLPTACENYAAASRQAAQYGPQAANAGANSFGFESDSDPAQTLKVLSDACDAEHARSDGSS